MIQAARIRLATAILAAARAKGIMIATAESCTGGLVAAALTDIAGSSDVLDRGFVTYSNEAKAEMLGVPPALIAAHGAVSPEVAGAMALGALKHSRAGLTVSITGIAGPGGGSAAKPVGLVHFAIAGRDGAVNRVERRFGSKSRAQIRQLALETALNLLMDALAEPPSQFA
ncbi:MAG: CinA family protein [Proteobacteria bacterium]|nr:CinA family protein [Pseudomonadota bacterium]